MEKYHKYVFDIPNRKFVGSFEEMYKNEAVENFDSWHQDDTRQFHRLVVQLLLNRFNFNSILDIGCGKGAFTHQLKKENNYILGVDISPTALKIAAERFPDLDFACADINDLEEFKKLFKGDRPFDIMLIMEVLSYCANWKEILAAGAGRTDYILISLFVPQNAIGFVKSHDELVEELNKYYAPVEIVKLHKVPFVIYLGKKL